MPRSHFAAALAALCLLAAPAASQAFRLPEDLGPIAGDPANAMASLPIDDETYDTATHCNPAPHKGVLAALRWLPRHTDGISWGTYRCEKWGARPRCTRRTGPSTGTRPPVPTPHS